MRVIVGEQVIAESVEVVRLGAECYFPPSAVRTEFLVETGHIRHCHWKGSAVCFSIVINDSVFLDAAWALPHPFWEAMEAKGMIAFDPAIVRLEQ